jgi:hypothetical protein
MQSSTSTRDHRDLRNMSASGIYTMRKYRKEQPHPTAQSPSCDLLRGGQFCSVSRTEHRRCLLPLDLRSKCCSNFRELEFCLILPYPIADQNTSRKVLLRAQNYRNERRNLRTADQATLRPVDRQTRSNVRKPEQAAVRNPARPGTVRIDSAVRAC